MILLYAIACLAIAFYLARFVNSRSPKLVTAFWSAPVAATIGWALSEILFTGVAWALGIYPSDPDHLLPKGTFLKMALIMAGFGFFCAVAGAFTGIYQGRNDAKGIKPMPPMKAMASLAFLIFHCGLLGLCIGILAITYIGYGRMLFEYALNTHVFRNTALMAIGCLFIIVAYFSLNRYALIIFSAFCWLGVAAAAYAIP